MGFSYVFESPVFVAKWSGFVDGDVEALFTALRDHKNGVPLTYVSWVPPDVSAPAGRSRAEFSSRTDELFEICDRVHMVLEGEGFVLAVKRSVLTAMQATSRHRSRLSVHGTLEGALGRAVDLTLPDRAARLEALSSRCRKLA